MRYSVTRLSKKFFSLPRSIVSLIQGKGLRGRVLAGQADALQAAVGDVADVVAEQPGVEAHDAAGQAVPGVGDLQVDGVADAWP